MESRGRVMVPVPAKAESGIQGPAQTLHPNASSAMAPTLVSSKLSASVFRRPYKFGNFYRVLRCALCCLWIVWTIGRFASKHRQTRISSPRSTQHRFIILITQLLHSFDILGHKLPICANYYKQHFGSWLVLNLGISLPHYIDPAPYTFSSHLSSQYCRFD